MVGTKQLPRQPACAPYDSHIPNAYGYRPSLAPGIVFVVLFGLSTIIHTIQTVRYRKLWCTFFIIGSGLECAGWAARLAGHECAYSRSLFIMQTSVLIMGPAWTQVGIYITLWVIITIVGREISPLPPKTYLFICWAVDFVCLTLQAVGGGLAGAASGRGEDTQVGTTIMVVGIISQLAAVGLFSIILMVVFKRGAGKIRERNPLFHLAVATSISTTMVILRGVYRSIELTQGWTGYLITHEAYVIALDAVPMFISMGVFNIFNPAALLSSQLGFVGDKSEGHFDDIDLSSEESR